MNKYQKAWYQGCIERILKIHMNIQQAIDENKLEILVEYFTCCQESAVELGTALEHSEGQDCEVVHQLEEYCDKVYEIYNLIEKAQDSNINNITEPLDEIIENVASRIREYKEKKLILFLPYNATMWDSLESVWERLRRDEKNDVKVIPIPYYDKNADGSFGKIHYELERYPAKVPVIDWKSYDFEKNRADEIYIHNPYDGGNTVTSVPPFFYAKNLKTLTDCLIYIPYFVLEDPDPDSAASLKGIEHFCLLPGVLHAHKVYLQSEKMREAYIRNLIHTISEEKIPKSYWENKIINYGSPKIEKIRQAKNEQLEVPDSWQMLIKQREPKRKIILYNSSVARVIAEPEVVLKKIENVLGFFEKQTDKVILLWRPHPLLRQTIEVNAPNLITKYDELVENYRRANWGIYDDTPDLDRALILADAYYGDYSSLVQLFKETGKPIMIQNPNLLYAID